MAKDHSKKRKSTTTDGPAPKYVKTDTSKPTAVFKPTKGRDHTVSLAIPGSIIGNAQTHDQKTWLAASIARALAVFCIDEVVVFNDGTSTQHTSRNGTNSHYADADAASGYTAYSDPDHFLAHVLSYLETPPHLRRRLFPHHPNLRSAGSMPSLDMPHHLRQDEWCRWREGVVQPDSEVNGATKRDAETSYADAGLTKLIRIRGSIPTDTRVTLDFGEELDEDKYNIRATAAHPAAPREVDGYYWGYSVRRADSLSAVFTECTFEGGYDLGIGTSERGEPVQDFLARWREDGNNEWQHVLVVFGGVAGLEVALKNDSELSQTVEDPEVLFDAYLNLVPNQGSRTIRTEEAVWLGCMGLRPFVTARDEG